jgi:hypothetical protein
LEKRLNFIEKLEKLTTKKNKTAKLRQFLSITKNRLTRTEEILARQDLKRIIENIVKIFQESSQTISVFICIM